MGTAIISAVKGNVSGRKALRLLDPSSRLRAARVLRCDETHPRFDSIVILVKTSNDVRFQGVAKSSSVTDMGGYCCKSLFGVANENSYSR